MKFMLKENMVFHYGDGTVFYNCNGYDHPMEQKFDMHIHDISEMIYLREGDVSVVIGEKTYKLPEHSVAFFRPNVPHRIRIDSDVPYKRYDVLFDETKIGNKIFLRMPKNIDVIHCRETPVITECFKKLDYYPNHFFGEDLTMLIHGVLSEILFNLSLIPKVESDEPLFTVNPLIESAVTYINEHYKQPITVEDICAHLNITKSYLHRLFVDEMQMSPKKYVNIKRLACAQKMIRIGNKPSHIYAECGFSEYATFFRNYMAYFGYAPSQENVVEVMRKINS